MLKRFWNWLLGKTTIDEKVTEAVKNTIVVTQNKIADTREELEEAIADAKEKVGEYSDRVKDAVNTLQGRIVIEGKVTKSKLRELKKAELIQHANEEFDAKFDDSLNKSNLINKVYELHKGRE